MPEAILPAELARRLETVEEAGAALRGMDRADRIAAIDRVAARWLDAGSPWRRRALETLPRTTGYAPAAIRHALDALWSALSAADVTAIAARELDTAAASSPAPLAFHSLAGNVPGAGIFGVVAALVAAVPSVVKTAQREPLLPALVAESLAAEDARLGAALSVAYWQGGSDAHEELAAARSGVVLGYGRTETLDNLARHAAGRLLRFGPRLSLALVCREAADARTAAEAARQVALYDQQGCLSPQLLVLEETNHATTTAFVDALAAALRRLATELPRAPLTFHEAGHVWRFVERQRWREQEGAEVRVVADASGAFSVVCDRTGTLPASPLHRHLIVAPVTSLADAGALLTRLHGAVEAVGVAAPAIRLAEAAAVADACGAHRLCPLARLQSPPFAWRQSGHARLASFLIRGTAETHGSERVWDRDALTRAAAGRR